MYPRSLRLRDRREWGLVRRRGRCANGTYTGFCVFPAPDGRERYGFTTTKGVRRAVDRNRARRRLREAFRSTYASSGNPVLIAGSARRESLGVEWEELRADVGAQLRRLGLRTR